MVSRSGRVKTPTELELLLKVMETSREVPASLERFAMNQVREAVMTGEGPPRQGGDLKPGQIGEAEVTLLRRILYAAAGAAISQAQAEMLFDLNDAVSAENNHPAWRELFVKAVANYLMAARVQAAPGRDEALRREKWLDSDGAGVMGILSQALSSGLRGFSDGKWHDVMSPRQAVAVERHDKFVTDTAVSEIITGDEAEWLASRINRDGQLHDAEKALLEFIKRESPDVHPSLKPLLDRVA